MATKAELETELAELKREFATLENFRTETPAVEPAKPGGAKKSKQPQGVQEKTSENEPQDGPDEVAAQKVADIERMTTQVMEELEDAFDKKTLLIALGALAAGYLIGRSR